MEPLTTINLGTCKWLGIIALACSAVAELLSLANSNSRSSSSVTHENARRAISRQTISR